jgi:hypothetical protein
MDYSNRHWVIINTDDVTDEMIKVSIQSGRETLRKSLDGSKAVLKWNGTTPSCFEGITIYNHSEVLEILRGEDWVEDVI